MNESTVISLDQRHLRAVAFFAPENDIRYYLNGVLVHVLDDGAVRLVATNGSAMAITNMSVSDLFQPPPCRFIIPIDIVKLIATRKSDNDVKVSIVDGESYKIECVGLSINFTPIEGTFPDYERVVPHAISGEVAQFDPELIARFAKAAAVYSGKSRAIRIEHNGDGGALVHANDDGFIGIVMPWRTGGTVGLPAWIKPGRAAPDADDTDAPQIGLPGVKSTEEAEADANDKPLSTVGDNEREPAGAAA